MTTNQFKTILSISLFLNIILAILVGYFYYYNIELATPIPLSEKEEIDYQLNNYAYDTLKKKEFAPQVMTFGDVLTEQEGFQTRMFYYELDGKKVSGLAHLPADGTNHPVIVMVRGYVDHAIYTPGVGTRRASEVFARHGYITLAPDFLGYGESDLPSVVPLEDRFQTYPTVLQLLSNIDKLNISLQNLDSQSGSGMTTFADQSNVGIWGHSNGGQIAISALEVSGRSYPTVLWAPVTKPFPYSVLYFTDEFDDNGRYLRRIIADFETDYDIERFSLSNYFSWIDAPLQLHQGGNDDAVPIEWSDEFVEEVEKEGISVDYYRYPSADHNLMPDWSQAVERSLSFFDKHLRQVSVKTQSR